MDASFAHPRVGDASVMLKEHIGTTFIHFGPSSVTSVLPPRAHGDASRAFFRTSTGHFGMIALSKEVKKGMAVTAFENRSFLYSFYLV